MATHILLEKISESETFVSYKFDNAVTELKDPGYGVVEFNKISGNYRIIKERDSDIEHGIARRAIWAILREWKKGSFPELLEWAS